MYSHNQDTWMHSDIVTNSSGTYLFREGVENKSGNSSGMYYPTSTTYFRVINVTELTKELVYFNIQNNGSLVAEVRNGVLQVCPPGCVDCNCTSCFSGYAYDNLTGLCKKCPLGCSSCSNSSFYGSSASLQCSSCNTGYFYSWMNYTCGACDSNCLSCYSSSSYCGTCAPGLTPQYNYTSYTYDCQSCSTRNCLSCSTYSGCTRCQIGFVSSSNNSYYYYSSSTNATCRKCSIYCSACDRDDITHCLNCTKGLELINGRCESCPQNCLYCKGTACAFCVEGFVPNSNNVCVPKCKLPCITCVDNQASNCTSCQKGSTLVNGQCVLDLTCNNDNSCKYCGQGLNYFLNPMSATGGKCLQCPSIPNCLQCNDLSTSFCMLCADGFFPNAAGLCAPCPANCSKCVNEKTCTACQTGWTLYDISPEGQCFKCESPCASCVDEPWLCLSCISGFTKKGWMCLNDSHLTFNFTLSASSATILNEIDNVTEGLFSLLNYAHNDSSIITIGTVTETSSRETILEGYIAPFEGSQQNA